MNRNEWIAVAVSVLVIGFFVFGDTAVSLFQQSAGGDSTATAVGANTPTDTAQTGGTLQYRDVVVGTGAEATPGSLVTVNYVGTFTNGQKFDSSIDRGQPIQFRLGAGQVIPGWDQGFAGMKVGGKRLLLVPPELAYGAQQTGPIPPNSTLIFEIELLKVEK